MRALCLLSALALTVICGCASQDGTPGTGDGGLASRAHKGAVHVLFDAGTRRVKLELDAGYPRASLDGRFALELSGSADAGSGPEQHGISLAIAPLKETPSYEFPRDRQQLSVAVTRGGQAVPVGTISGFLRIAGLDEAERLGSAVVSIALNDAAGYGLVEIDITLADR